MGLDDDADCEHIWELVEMRPSLRGMDQVFSCARPRCDAVSLRAAQATLRDTRPPL